MLHLLCRLWFVRQLPLSNTGVIITRLVGFLMPGALTVSLLATSEMWLTLCARLPGHCARYRAGVCSSIFTSLDLSSTGCWRRVFLFLTFALCLPDGAPLTSPLAPLSLTLSKAQGASVRSPRGCTFTSTFGSTSPRVLGLRPRRPVSRCFGDVQLLRIFFDRYYLYLINNIYNTFKIK